MDPDACLRSLLENLAEGNREEAVFDLDSLAAWLAREGFLPTVIRVTDYPQPAPIYRLENPSGKETPATPDHPGTQPR